jgi:preprotein translocase subunit SecG
MDKSLNMGAAAGMGAATGMSAKIVQKTMPKYTHMFSLLILVGKFCKLFMIKEAYNTLFIKMQERVKFLGKESLNNKYIKYVREFISIVLAIALEHYTTAKINGVYNYKLLITY